MPIVHILTLSKNLIKNNWLKLNVVFLVYKTSSEVAIEWKAELCTLYDIIQAFLLYFEKDLSTA